MVYSRRIRAYCRRVLTEIESQLRRMIMRVDTGPLLDIAYFAKRKSQGNPRFVERFMVRVERTLVKFGN